MKSSIMVTFVRPSISISRHGRCPSIYSKLQARHQSSYSLDTYLVSPAQLSSALQKNVHSRISTAPRVIPLCAAWFMPNDPQKRTGYKSFLEKRIPHARFFDLDKVKDDKSPYPHMLPTPETFAKEMSKLGIRKDDSVVVYDTAELGIFSAPRVAWTLRVFGHGGVHILNNFRLWVEQAYPTESGEPEPVEEVYYPVPDLDKSKVVLFEEMKERALEQEKEGAEPILVLDARSQGRFDGAENEPRPGLPSGHMPGATNVPFDHVLDSRKKTFMPADQLKLYLDSHDIKLDKPIISSCGTGVTACILDAALTEIGYPEHRHRVYDGSWTEWAQQVKPEENLIKKK